MSCRSCIALASDELNEQATRIEEYTEGEGERDRDAV